ncbi:hypothetical protein [Croceimicrobium hydrocarbonivorans]|uniref:Uncharacterized protein n=1 Tax=Croceimicrobium hydrocarbonivorans TaxID=2761580 RepID=A0A7H0VHD9_9FLAO|nr:hypothetical protein [Croceimicrobium hydrocarbonivorans]QNR25137.1 hypothetical protein H4K34_04680 [Croceimicrobium hydrocarbonivorans]
MKTAVLSILIIGLGAILNSSKPISTSANAKDVSKVSSEVRAKDFVETIESLGYFKYADPENIERLKKSHLESFDPEGAWGGIWDDETNLPLDYRYYFCDGEYVFEQGGFTGILEEMDLTFKKIGFKLSIENHYEEWDSDNQWLNHRITLNGTEYVIFKNFTRGYGWGEAVQRLAEIVNSELAKQKKDERIYLINGGNDGALIFLNDGLYKYFYETFTDPQWKPLAVSEWAKLMGVQEMELD